MNLNSGFRLGHWSVYPPHGSISDGGDAVHLEPKVMGVLMALAAREGEVVTRDEFIQKVWMGRVVSDEVLSRCISLLRSALGDNPRKPIFVQTVPRVGYRLIVPVEKLDEPAHHLTPVNGIGTSASADSAPLPATPPTRRTGRRYLKELQRRNVLRIGVIYAILGWIALEAIWAFLPSMGAPGWTHKLLTTLVVLGWPVVMVMAWVGEVTPGEVRLDREVQKQQQVTRIRGRKLEYVLLSALAIGFLYLMAQRWAGRDATDEPVLPRANVPALAVLPFVNVGDEGDEDYFTDGLTEELINALSRVKGLRVVSRTSAFAYKGRRGDVREIGRDLGVTTLLEGSVRKSGDELRISARLVDVDNGTQLWGDTYEGRFEDVFTLQDSITSAIVIELLPKLKERGALKQLAAAPPTADLEAYELYLRGIAQLRKRDEDPMLKSIRLFREAIERDPRFAEAYAQLATAYALLPYYSYELEEDMFARAREVIDRGIAQNPEVEAGAQGVLAFMAFRNWDWVDAELSFRRALFATPNDSNLHQWYSQFLAFVGQLERSQRHAARAKELDVLSPVVNDRLAVTYLWLDQDEAAQTQFALARELGLAPTANPEGRLVLQLRTREYEAAGDTLRLMQKLLGRDSGWIDAFLNGTRDPAARPAAVAELTGAAERGEISRRYLLGAWLLLDEHDRAMDLAFRLIRDPANFDLEFLFAREAAGLRGHPRFEELVRTIGIDRHWEEFGWPEACQQTQGRIVCK
jgi:TolB-like protein/DNA-binding winged helix-turn-helix (wHTH) protein/Tfp pilus assembly protein PilF